MVAAGTLASKYEKLGGEVKWMGKPDKVIAVNLLTLHRFFMLMHNVLGTRCK